MNRLKSFAVAASLAVWFLGQTWQGIFTQFEDDDLMNMYFAWTLPLGKLILANLTPFTSVYRPLGSLLYRTEYVLFGLNPLPFRIVAYALMMLNIWLVYRLARRLTGSVEIAVLSALLFSFHKRTFGMYVNNGTIYDVLCFTFFCLALSFYIGTRQKYGRIPVRHLIAFCALYTLALNSKEMAAVLPVVLLAYEVIYHKQWKTPVLWISVAITVLAFAGKNAAGSSFAGNPDYALHVSWRQFFATTRPLLSELFFLPTDALNTTKAVLVLVVVWAIAIVSRKKSMLMGAVMITVLPLPINFIAYRGFFVMYLPLLGWAIYLASVLVACREWLWKNLWKRPLLPDGTWEPEPVFLFLVTAAVLFSIQSRDTAVSLDYVTPHQQQIRTLRQDLSTIRRPSSVLFLQDDFEVETWNPLYIVRLTYRDAAIPVERVKRNAPSIKYDLSIDYRDGHYVTIGSLHE